MIVAGNHLKGHRPSDSWQEFTGQTAYLHGSGEAFRKVEDARQITLQPAV